MVDTALLYVGGLVLLFFFWIYGIVAFVRDTKNYLLPAYRQWRRGGEGDSGPPEQHGGQGPGDAP